KDVVERFLPYWEEGIKPDLVDGKTVLIAAHGNSLRALVKYLDGISDEEISGLNIPTGQPLVYELDADFQPVEEGGRYLDPVAAKAAAEAVANQGKKCAEPRSNTPPEPRDLSDRGAPALPCAHDRSP